MRLDFQKKLWNPFLAAPFGSSQAMDDSHFGKCFDELPRKSEREGGEQDRIVLTPDANLVECLPHLLTRTLER